MVLARWQRSITDEAGNVLPLASIEVRREVTGQPLAVLYKDRNAVELLGNPFQADSDGFAFFHVQGGAFQITASLGSFSQTLRYVPIGTAAESDTLGSLTPPIVLGHTESIPAFNFESPLQLHGHGAEAGLYGISLFEWDNSAVSQFLDYNKSRGGTPGTHGIVQSGDNLGIWDCAGDDGTNFIQSVTLRARVDGTPGTNDMPGRLEIRTTPDGSSTSRERVRISATGMTTIWGTEVPTSTTSVSPTYSDTPLQVHSGAISNAATAFLYWFNDQFGPTHNFVKTRGSGINVWTIAQSGDQLGAIGFFGADGTDAAEAARIQIECDGTPGNNDMPGRIILRTTPDGSASSVERMRIANGGNIYCTGAGTTANAANAFLDSGSTPANELLRSTSAARFKRDIEDLDSSHADALLSLRPVWYRSAIQRDRQDWSWYGLVAEEVAAVDPRLVHWGYADDDYEVFEIVEKRGEDGIQGRRTERRLKAGATLKPDGVTYDRLSVMLLSIVQRQQDRIAALEAKI